MGVEFAEGEREELSQGLLKKGLLVNKGGILELTEEGKELAKQFDVIILYED
jgi:hypothetical protein